MNTIIAFLYSLDFGWLGMASLVVVGVLLLMAGFIHLAKLAMRSEEEIQDEWRKEAR